MRWLSSWIEQFGQPALDRVEMVEAGVGGVELLDQSHDPVLEMVDRGLVGAASLELVDLVGEASHHGFEAGAHRRPAPRECSQRVGDRRDPPLHGRERIGGGVT